MNQRITCLLVSVLGAALSVTPAFGVVFDDVVQCVPGGDGGSFVPTFSLSISGPRIFDVGETVQFIAQMHRFFSVDPILDPWGLPSGSPAAPRITWSVDDPGIAEVTPYGLVTGISHGTTQVHATRGVQTASRPVTVAPTCSCECGALAGETPASASLLHVFKPVSVAGVLAAKGIGHVNLTPEAVPEGGWIRDGKVTASMVSEAMTNGQDRITCFKSGQANGWDLMGLKYGSSGAGPCVIVIIDLPIGGGDHMFWVFHDNATMDRLAAFRMTLASLHGVLVGGVPAIDRVKISLAGGDNSAPSDKTLETLIDSATASGVAKSKITYYYKNSGVPTSNLVVDASGTVSTAETPLPPPQEGAASGEREGGLFLRIESPGHSSGSSRLEVTGNGRGTLRLFDVRGRQVKVLASGDLSGWKQSIPLGGLRPGVYFLHVQTRERAVVRRLVVLP